MCETPEEFATFTQGTMAAESALRSIERGVDLSLEERQRIAEAAFRAIELAPRGLNSECRENLEAAVALAPTIEMQQPA